jgi:hypothetical protein
MTRSLRLLIGTAVMLSLSPIAAKADLFVGACAVNGAVGCTPTNPANTIASNTTNLPLTYNSTVGAFDVSGSASVTSPPPTFGSNNLSITVPGVIVTTPSTIDIFVTGTNINQAGMGILSNLQVNALPAGWTATVSTYLNTNNSVYGTQIPLSTSSLLNGPIPPGPQFSLSQLAGIVTPGTPFSITEKYEITVNTNSTGDFEGQIRVSAVPVPGPIVGAGLPGLIAACGSLLLLARRRRQRQQV